MSARPGTAYGSLAWLFLVGIVALGIGALLFLSFDALLTDIFDRGGWADATGDTSPSDTAEDVESGQGYLESIWTIVPVIIVVAVGFSVLIRARRIRR